MHGYVRSESGKARAEVGSTRWVYNKFLRTQTKLRWVCGLCGVWCKDENGFKCHLEHENHIRKSELARRSRGHEFKVTARDEAFAQRFVRYLAQNYLNQKVLLHQVYAEMYPQDAKKQLLIKDTCWGALGVFINALSKAGEIEAGSSASARRCSSPPRRRRTRGRCRRWIRRCQTPRLAEALGRTTRC
mmetsp:Transcript_17760/g.56000  ORF Transcript_17760/g.56000 Transcript_17760/m.56000 type:complete len:188 (-) Transcript_17760:456-1019(-)